MSWPRIFWDTLGNVMSQDTLGYFWQYHGLGYFWILGIFFAMSCPRIFWDTFGNIMTQDILGYFWQYHGLGYFGTSMVQGYKRRQSGEQPFSRSTPVDGSIKLVLSCNSPLVCSRSITNCVHSSQLQLPTKLISMLNNSHLGDFTHFEGGLNFNQFGSSLAFSQLGNVTQLELGLKCNQLDLCMCFTSQDLDYVTHVDQPAKNLSKKCALVTTSQIVDYTLSNDTHVITINNVCKKTKEMISKKTPSYLVMPLKNEALKHLCETLRS